MREQQQKRRVIKALHQALTKAHHRMLLATFANHSASKWLRTLHQLSPLTKLQDEVISLPWKSGVLLKQVGMRGGKASRKRR